MMYSAHNTMLEAYQGVLRDLMLCGRPVSPRGLPCRELRDYAFTVRHPSDSSVVTADEERNVRVAKYTKAEFELYASGTDLTEHFAKHAPFWREVADGEHINSAYGKVIWFDRTLDGGTTTPWEWARGSLLNDVDTRQAVLPFIRPDHFKSKTKDLVCTLEGTFSVQASALCFTVVMRSNDAVKGLVYDAPWFMHLLITMRANLEMMGLRLDLGTYTHFAHSMHLYERDASMAQKMLFPKE